MSQAIHALSLPPDATHCHPDNRADCTHTLMRNVIAQLAFPAYIVKQKTTP